MNVTKIANLFTKGVTFVKDNKIPLCAAGGIVGCYFLEKFLTDIGIMTPPQRQTIQKDYDEEEIQKEFEKMIRELEEFQKNIDTLGNNNDSVVDIEG